MRGFIFFFSVENLIKKKEKVSLHPLPDLNLQALAEIELFCWDPHCDNYPRQQWESDFQNQTGHLT